MSDTFPPNLKERNPITSKIHRSQTIWQIYLPLVVGLIVVVIVAVFAGLASTEAASRWADISLIFLIIPVMVAIILFLAFTSGFIYVVSKLIQVIPIYAFQIQEMLQMVSQRVRRGADLAVEPVMRVHAFKAALQTLRGKLRL